jgi:hypothetical protein
MTEAPQECIAIDEDAGASEFLEFDNDDDQSPIEIEDIHDTDGRPPDKNVCATNDPDYLDIAKDSYGPLGAPPKFIKFMAGLLMRLDALKDPRCDTHAREMMIRGGLGLCMDAALAELVTDISLGVDRVAALALEIRTLMPEVFDEWVNLQFTVGRPLAMVTAKRKGGPIPRERFIEEQLKEGKLIAGAVMSEASHLENFVGILRLTLEAELNVNTVNEQIELDLALKNYVLARRFAFTAQSLIPSSGPLLKDLGKNLDLMDRVEKFDRNFQLTIDRMRARNRRKSRTVQLAVKKRVTVAVTATTEESDGKKAIPA